MATDANEHPQYEPPRVEDLVTDAPVKTGAALGVGASIGVGYFGGLEADRGSLIKPPR